MGTAFFDLSREGNERLRNALLMTVDLMADLIVDLMFDLMVGLMFNDG